MTDDDFESDTDRIVPEELNWQTGAEMIDERGEQLGVSEEILKDARDLAVEAGLNGDLSDRKPSSVAAACVYFVSLLHNQKLTQETVGNVFGVSKSITPAYHALAEAEGFDVEPDSEDRDVTGEGSLHAEDHTTVSNSTDSRMPSFGTILIWAVPLLIVGIVFGVFGGAVFSGIPEPAFRRAAEDVTAHSHKGQLTFLVISVIVFASSVVVSWVNRRLQSTGVR